MDCYCKYSRVLDPGGGSTQTHIRRETDGTQQEHWQCLLLAFFICWHGYHTKCKASDACYRWQKTVPVDGTCICLPAWLADNHSTASTKNPVWLSRYKQTQPVFSPPKLYAPHLCKPGKNNTLMHSCFSKSMPNNGSGVSKSLLMSEMSKLTTLIEFHSSQRSMSLS